MSLAEILKSSQRNPEFFYERLHFLLGQIESTNAQSNIFLRRYFSRELLKHYWPSLVEQKLHNPFFGSLFAVKDNIAVGGQPLSLGLSPDFKAQCEVHAEIIQYLIAAGATLFGSTNLDPAAAAAIGDNPFYGRIRNPRFPDRIPAGSSGGAAAAVAGGLVDFAIGTDLGGSTRLPAAACGITGLRCRTSSLPTSGVVLHGPLDSIGLLTAKLSDLKILWQLFGAAADTPPKVPEFLVPAQAELSALFPDLPPDFQKAVDLLKHNFRVYELDSEFAFDEALGIWQILASKEVAKTLASQIDSLKSLDPKLAALWSMAAKIDAGQISRAQDHQAKLKSKWETVLAGSSILLTPTLSAKLPAWSQVYAPKNAKLRLNSFLCPANLGDFAALSCPLVGLDIFPFSLQLMSSSFSEAALIEAGLNVTEALDNR